MYVILCGNPVDGLSVYGPFHTSEEANEWADRELRNADSWWVTDLVQLRQPTFYMVATHHEMAEKPDLKGPFETHDEAVAYAEAKSLDTEIYICERVQ